MENVWVLAVVWVGLALVATLVAIWDDSTAEQFARERIKHSGLSGTNIGEFLDKVLKFSGGNPGAIIALIDMATCPKYRSEEHIKISPLYIDFRMNGGVAR